MKKFKGTQGKWYYYTKDKVIYIQNENEVRIAEIDMYKKQGFQHEVLGCFQLWSEHSFFDAKLITSAPKLFSELQKLILFCELNNVGADLDIAKDVINDVTCDIKTTNIKRNKR